MYIIKNNHINAQQPHLGINRIKQNLNKKLYFIKAQMYFIEIRSDMWELQEEVIIMKIAAKYHGGEMA